MSLIDHGMEVVRRRLGKPDVQWCQVEAVGGGFLFTVGTPTKTITRGPNKGQPNWRGVPLEKCIVTKDDVEAERAAYERSGKCAECLGEKKMVAGWSKDTGTKYQACRACGGTGEARRP